MRCYERCERQIGFIEGLGYHNFHTPFSGSLATGCQPASDVNPAPEKRSGEAGMPPFSAALQQSCVNLQIPRP